MNNDKVIIEIPCRQCGVVHKVRVGVDDLFAWQNGDKLIQDAFPYLSTDKRELLLTRICPDCWNRMFGQEE